MSWPVASHEPHVAVRGSGQTERVAATAAAAGPRFAAAFDAPDGKTVLKVWDEAGNVLFTANDAPAVPDPSSCSAKRVELSRDGTRLAYYGWEAGASGREAEDGRPAARLGRRNGPGGVPPRRGNEAAFLYHAAFSPDGRRLATTWSVSNGPRREAKAWDYWVSIWDLETGRESLHLDVPLATRLAFSPDGRRLAGGLAFASDEPEAAGERAPGLGRRDGRDGPDAEVRARPDRRRDLQRRRHVAGRGRRSFVGDVGDAGVIKVLDAASGQERLSLAGHRDQDLEARVQPRRDGGWPRSPRSRCTWRR